MNRSSAPSGLRLNALRRSSSLRGCFGFAEAFLLGMTQETENACLNPASLSFVCWFPCSAWEPIGGTLCVPRNSGAERPGWPSHGGPWERENKIQNSLLDKIVGEGRAWVLPLSSLLTIKEHTLATTPLIFNRVTADFSLRCRGREDVSESYVMIEKSEAGVRPSQHSQRVKTRIRP